MTYTVSDQIVLINNVAYYKIIEDDKALVNKIEYDKLGRNCKIYSLRVGFNKIKINSYLDAQKEIEDYFNNLNKNART